MCPFGKRCDFCVINSSNKPLLHTYYVLHPNLVLTLQSRRIDKQINRLIWNGIGSTVLVSTNEEDLTWSVSQSGLPGGSDIKDQHMQRPRG